MYNNSKNVLFDGSKKIFTFIKNVYRVGNYYGFDTV